MRGPIVLLFSALFCFQALHGSMRRNRRRVSRSRGEEPKTSLLERALFRAEYDRDEPNDNEDFQQFISEALDNHGKGLDEALLEVVQMIERGGEFIVAKYVEALIVAGANPNAKASSGFIVNPDYSVVSMRHIGRDVERPAGTHIFYNTPHSLALKTSRRVSDGFEDYDDYEEDDHLFDTNVNGGAEDGGRGRKEQVIDVLVRLGAEPMDDTAIFRTLLTGSIRQFNWFTKFQQFPAHLLTNPIFALMIVKSEGLASDYLISYFLACGGQADMKLPDGSNLMMHASKTCFKCLLGRPQYREALKAVGPRGTMLHYLADGKFDFRSVKAIFKLAQHHGLSLNALNDEGNTPIMEAALCRSNSVRSCLQLILSLLPHSEPVRNRAGQSLLDILEANPAFQSTSRALLYQAISLWERRWAMGTFEPAFRDYFPKEVLSLIEAAYPIVESLGEPPYPDGRAREPIRFYKSNREPFYDDFSQIHLLQDGSEALPDENEDLTMMDWSRRMAEKGRDASGMGVRRRRAPFFRPRGAAPLRNMMRDRRLSSNSPSGSIDGDDYRASSDESRDHTRSSSNGSGSISPNLDLELEKFLYQVGSSRSDSDTSNT